MERAEVAALQHSNVKQQRPSDQTDTSVSGAWRAECACTGIGLRLRCQCITKSDRRVRERRARNRRCCILMVLLVIVAVILGPTLDKALGGG